MTAAGLEPVARPDGRLYRPRRLTADAVTDEDDSVSGVVVFGTHDPGRAQDLADVLVRRDVGPGCTAVDPVPVWWRDGFSGGHRQWISDEVTGRAGVWFREIVEASG